MPEIIGSVQTRAGRLAPLAGPSPPLDDHPGASVHAHEAGHHSHLLSDAEMEWICWSAAILALAFLLLALWSHHGPHKLAPRPAVRFRSFTKRRPRRRRRGRK
jgi:hypothetical protein